MRTGTVSLPYQHYRGEWEAKEKEVVEEDLVCIFVNGVELVTLMATPQEQDKLALGFLCNEGVITALGDVRDLHVSKSGACVDVWLNRADFEPPKRRIITSGCGGGVTFDDFSQALQPLDETPRLTVTPEHLGELMPRLQPPGSLHALAGGTHTAGLSDGAQLLAVCEDIGRHNTIDKLCGACLQAGLSSRGRLLLCTGRISSDMLRKAARMGCPVVASRTTPTSLAVQLAQAWNITLVGYVRQGTLSVYTHPERIGAAGPVSRE